MTSAAFVTFLGQTLPTILLYVYLGGVLVKTWLTAAALSGPNSNAKNCSNLNGLLIGIVLWPIGTLFYILTKSFEPETKE